MRDEYKTLAALNMSRTIKKMMRMSITDGDDEKGGIIMTAMTTMMTMTMTMTMTMMMMMMMMMVMMMIRR